VQENSGYAKDGLVEHLVGCSRVSYSTQGVHDGGGNGTGSFVTEIWLDAAKLMDVFIKNEAKVMGRVDCVK